MSFTANMLNIYRKGFPVWDKAVSKTPWMFMDPMVESLPIINKDMNLTFMGCCFAQRMCEYMRASGYTIYVAESQPKGVSLFSARYGNIFSIRQLLQLMQRAYGRIDAVDESFVWKRVDNGCHVDAFRPYFCNQRDNPNDVIVDTIDHLRHVRNVFENLSVLILSAVSTEAWEAEDSGMIFPFAPGVVVPRSNALRIRFKNFTVSEIVGDLSKFAELLVNVNPAARIIFTVSPAAIPMTFDANRHVLAANTYSKAALCCASREICDTHAYIHYFPAYEIIAGNYSASRFYERNLRDVSNSGANFAMRLFVRHFTAESSQEDDAGQFVAPNYDNVICDPQQI